MKHDWAELAAMAYVKAAEPKNDPNYSREVADQLRDAKTLQASVTSVQVISGYDPHVRVRAGKDIGRVRAAAAAIGRIADIDVNDPNTKAPNGYRQPPVHTFYKDDREYE